MPDASAPRNGHDDVKDGRDRDDHEDDWFTDAERLADQYADAGNLSARVALHERFSTADRPFRPWLLDRMRERLGGDARVLTLGCGAGDLYAENAGRVPAGWAVTLTDASPGMVREARERVDDADALAVADAAAPPFATRAFDAVTANHMLYHVPDRRRALREIRRVLVPGGHLFAATNGAGNMRALFALLESVHGGPIERGSGFRLANGREQLAAVFASVDRVDYDDGLRVTDPEAVVDYALSRAEFSPADAPALRAAVEDAFEDGALEVHKEVGLLVAERG
jgi:SAM-dependent methyltransferase